MNRRSSFYWAMRLLPRSRREAMFAIYDYCRVLDDIADEPGKADDKRARLAVMRGAVAALFETGVALHPTLGALAPAIRRYGLPRAEFEALIEGMEMDVNAPLTAPPMATLVLYCRRVAGAVGMLAVRVFERADAERFAALLGEALQLTNILRDVAEDADLGRLYLPAEILAKAGITATGPKGIVSHPALPAACAALAVIAERRYAEAEAELARIGRAGLWPAIAMMATYRVQLARLVRAGWRHPDAPPRLSRALRLWIALRAAVWA